MKQQINLYQAQMRNERPAFSAAAMGAGIALCSVALIAAWFLAHSHAADLNTQLHAIQQQEAAAAARLQMLTQTLASSQDDVTSSSTLQNALVALKQREQLLNLIDGNTLGGRDGFSQALRALASHSLGGLWLTRIHVTAPGLRTTLEGRATSPRLVPEYLLGLTENDALNGQRFDAFRIERVEDKQSAVVTFSMTSQLEKQTAGGGASP